MNTGRLVFAAVWVLCLHAPALTAQECHSLEGMLEEPPGVRIVASHGFAPSAANDARFAMEDAAVADLSDEASSLVLEVAGPRTLRLYHRGGSPNSGGDLRLQLDGRKVEDFRPMLASADVTVPAGLHHVEMLASATPVALSPVALYKVVDLAPGLPVLTQPDITLPAGAGVSLRLPVESDSPVTWSAAGLPDGLMLEAATGRITGVAPELVGGSLTVSAWVTMTNAQGSQVEHLRIWGMNPLQKISSSLPLAGRRARTADAKAFFHSIEDRYQTVPPDEAHVSWSAPSGNDPTVPELVTTVQGPDTLWFRARGSSDEPGPVVVKIDGVLVLRQFVRTTAWDEISVAIPAGEHEVTWQFPPGGRLDRVRLESALQPRLRGPFTLTAVPDAPFSLTLSAARGGQFRSDALPPGVVLDQISGILSGTLPAGDYAFPVTVQQNDESDTALYRLQVRENAAAVLGTPALTWLQSAGPSPWRTALAGPDGGPVWEFFTGSAGTTGELSRMETIIHGPDALACRFAQQGTGSLDIELDSTRHTVPRTFPGWENYLTVSIPPGRHVLALRALGDSSTAAVVQVLPLQFASAGAPVLTIPPLLYTDGSPVRVPVNLASGAADAVAASGLPDGLSVSGSEITGSRTPSPATFSSVISAVRGGRTTSARVEWGRSEINEWIDSAGWYGYSDRISATTPNSAPDSWDGLSALQLLVRHYGAQETGIARLITGPDTLTFRRRSRDGVRLEVKVDGAVVHGELVNTAAWQKVKIAIPAGGHHVSVSARPEHMGDESVVTPYESGDYAYLMLDDFRLDSDLSPAITDSTRRIETMSGESFAFRPQTERKIEEWRLTGAPPGFDFDTRTGTLSAAAVSAPSDEYSLIFTASNAHGSDDIRIVLSVVAPPAHGDSPRLLLQKNDWDFEPEGFEPPIPVDGGDVHYAVYNNLGTMSAWVDGPDTMQFWWRYMTGDTFFIVQLDGEAVYRPTSYVTEWLRQEIAIPQGRHLVTWFGYDTVAMDHITLASDGIPQPLTEQVYVVDPAGFSLPLTARNAPLAWEASRYTISAAGVLSGVLDPPEEQTVRLSAINAAGTGHAVITLRPETPLNAVLDSPLTWTSEPGAWWPETPAPGVLPAPADGEDFLRMSADAANPLTVGLPTGGGLLSFWARSASPGQSVEISSGPYQSWLPDFVFDLPDTDWHRILIPLHDEDNYILEIMDSTPASLWLDRAELLRPGDAIIDLCPLPELRAGAPWTAQLKLITGGPVQWQVTGLPAGLTLDSATGTISGTVSDAALPATHELRITARSTDGRSTFAWMKLRQLESLASALDTHTLTWRDTLLTPSSGWRSSTGSSSFYKPRDGVDYVSCTTGSGGLANLTTTVTGPGALSFWWAGPTINPPRFYVNGTLRAAAAGSIHNSLRRYAVNLPQGEHELRWEITNPNAPEDGEGFLDRVLWSGDAPPLFTCDTFDIEVAPGSPVARIIPTNGAPAFSSTGLPPGFSLNAATGLLTGTAPVEGGALPFTVRIEQDGRTDTARFRLLVRPTAAEALDTPGASWHHAAGSLWRTVNDPDIVRPGGGSAFSLGDPSPANWSGSDELQLFVDAPCFVTWWSKLESAGPGGASLEVRADDLSPNAFFSRRQPGAWQRGLIAVPGNGRRLVNFSAFRDAATAALYLDTVNIFPWHTDANHDGLTNGMACALARWPDAVSAGAPPFLLAPHPSFPDFRLVCFGSAAGDPALFPTRDHAIRLHLEQGQDLQTWQSAAATEEAAGVFGNCWRIPAPAAPRIFHRVQALPVTRVAQ